MAAAATEPKEDETPAHAWPSMSRKQCEEMVEHAQTRNMTVKFMIEKLHEAGCAVGPAFFKVMECDKLVGGGFAPGDGVVTCYNHVGSQTEVDEALVHELIHAYDHCRAANLDWTNLEHHACSEIRAASLSGDCSYKRETQRGHFTIRGQHQVCVKRRAELSVAMNPHCSSHWKARAAIDRVFDTCFADTAPFDRRP